MNTKKLYRLAEVGSGSWDIYWEQVIELDEKELEAIKPLVNFHPDGQFCPGRDDFDRLFLFDYEPAEEVAFKIPKLEPAMDTVIEGIVDEHHCLDGWPLLNREQHFSRNKEGEDLRGSTVRAKVIGHRLELYKRYDHEWKERVRVAPELELLEVIAAVTAPSDLKGRELLAYYESKGITLYLFQKKRILRAAGEDV